MSVITSFCNLWKLRRIGKKELVTFEKQFHYIVLVSLILPLSCTCFNSTILKYKDFHENADKPSYPTLSQKCPKLCRCFTGVYDISSKVSSLKEVEIDTEPVLVADCIRSGITKLPTLLPHNTRTFLLDYNSIKMLGDSMKGQNGSTVLHFSNYANVEKLSLRENQLQQIDRLAFHVFHSLKTLILSHNYISNLEWTDGLSGKSLLYLDVSFNQISALNKGDFEKMSLLKRLDLRSNDIESIGPFAFESLSSLEYLDLSSNKISNQDLHQKAFSQLQALSFLSFANNHRITKVPQFDVLGFESGTLESLDLHGLHFMTSVESVAFEGLNNLKSLNLSFCALNDLKLGWLNGGPSQSLEVLDLSHNRFTEIKSNFFVSAAMDTEIEINSAGPQQDLNSLSYVVSPSVLETKSQISFVKYEGHLTKSQEKKLYRPLPKLAWLSMSDNRYLEQLDDDAFALLPSLEYIFLQKCNISKMKIASNNYQYSDAGVLATLPKLKGIWIFGNPMYCDCYVRVIRTSTSPLTSNCLTNHSGTERKLVLLDADEYFYNSRCTNVTPAGKSRCYPRQSVETFPIALVPESYLFCPEEPMSLFIAMCIGPLAFAAAIALVFLCGWFTVLIGRARRYNICYYRLDGNHDNKKIELPVHKSAPSGKTALHTKMFQHQTASPATSNRNNRGTNLVMANLRSVKPESSHIPNSLLGSLTPVSGRATLTKTRKKEKRNLSPVPSISAKNSAYSDIQLVNLSNTCSSNSYPNISTTSDVNKTKKEYWKHALPEASAQRTCKNSIPDDGLHYIDSDDVRTLASETEFLVPKRERHWAETSSLLSSSSSMSGTNTRHDTSSEQSRISCERPTSRSRTRKERLLNRDLL